ncbi:MAG TPA: hypothetical protein VHD81_00895 [Mycobacteriales bacterium]|nr:hypothetical protein [Mycobacteriales bacterium]
MTTASLACAVVAFVCQLAGALLLIKSARRASGFLASGVRSVTDNNDATYTIHTDDKYGLMVGIADALEILSRQWLVVVLVVVGGSAGFATSLLAAAGSG